MNSSSFISETDQSITDNDIVAGDKSSQAGSISKDKQDVDNHNNQNDKDTSANKKKKKHLLDDDFFSLSGSFEHKKKKKHKHKHKHSKDNDRNSTGNKGNEKGLGEEIIQDLTISVTDEEIPGDIIEIGSNESTDLKIKPENGSNEKSLSITPPLVDKAKIKSEIATRIDSQYARKSTPGLLDSDEESDHELEELLKLTGTKSASVHEQSPEVYNFDQENEKKRKYVIRITSKLPTPDNQALQVDFGAKGLKTFEKIIKAAVDYFKGMLANKISPAYLFSYDPQQVCMVWVEGRTLVRPFYTPRTLRVPPPGQFNPLIEDIEKMTPTLLQFFLIPKEYSETFTKIYPEFKSSNPVNIVPEPIEVPDENSSSSDDEEEEEGEDTDADEEIIPLSGPEIVPGSSADQPLELDEDEGGFFVIGLKGKDNKRIEVKVSSETKLRNLLTFYLKLKGLSEDTVDISNAKFIFDDEELNLDETVGDTELEEDYEIQVKL